MKAEAMSSHAGATSRLEAWGWWRGDGAAGALHVPPCRQTRCRPQRRVESGGSAFRRCIFI